LGGKGGNLDTLWVLIYGEQVIMDYWNTRYGVLLGKRQSKRLLKFQKKRVNLSSSLEKEACLVINNVFGGMTIFREVPLFDRIIVDFLVCDLDLIIEVDGPYHDKPFVRISDIQRDGLCYRNNLRVVRLRYDNRFYWEKLLRTEKEREVVLRAKILKKTEKIIKRNKRQSINSLENMRSMWELCGHSRRTNHVAI
jgi:very-short-patch-repair endonuclease